jgi:hypothetical protein
MWNQVSGGPGPLWVQEEECRLPNGDLAFVYEAVQAPPLPGWFGAPADSTLRESSDLRVVGMPLTEIRSMRANAGQVLAFYGDRIERGGLARTEEPQAARGGPGFCAENTEYIFRLDVYEHKDLVFWTIHFGAKAVRKRKPTITSPLLLVGRNEERVTLRHPYTTDEYWAPVDALRDSEPPDARREPPRTEPIVWRLLPAWAQFSLDSLSEGEVYRSRSETGAEEWNASIRTPVEGDPQSVFESCLDSLDAHGFDASRTQRQDRSYFVSVLQRGHSRNAHVQSEAGDRAIATVLNTLGHLELLIRYFPSQGEFSRGS